MQVQPSLESFYEDDKEVLLYKIGWSNVNLISAREAFNCGIQYTKYSHAHTLISVDKSTFHLATDSSGNDCFYWKLLPSIKMRGTLVSLNVYALNREYDPLKFKVDFPLKKTYQKFLDSGILVKVDRKYLKYDSKTSEISLLCFLSVVKGLKRGQTCYTDEEKLSRYKKHGEIFLKTLTSGEYSDVSVRVGNKEFSAHRLVLSALSPVFAAMFKHPMKENEDNVIEVNDCEPEAMELFLCYLYSGTLGNTSGFLSQVFQLAHKYQVEELTEECEMRLIAKLNLKTSLEIFKLAHLFERKKLKDVTLNLFKENQETLFKTESWAAFENTQSKLALKLVKMCLTK